MVTTTSINAPKTIDQGVGPDTLILKISQDAYLADAQYLVFVDGKQVGDVFAASALHKSGQSDTVTLRGDFGTGPHDISVQFINDTMNTTTGEDRNLYVDAVTYNGVTIGNAKANLFENGTATTRSVTMPVNHAIDVGQGADTIVLKLSEDAYQGDAQYQVFVDGKQVGGTFAASAARGSGQSDTVTLRGDFGPGQHDISVKFINDARNVKTGEDRNLFVESVAYNGVTIGDSKANLFAAGTATARTVTAAAGGAIDIGKGGDTLVLKMAEDAYKGDAQYQVFVDGKQVGGTLSASSTRASGKTDTVTLHGDWGPGTHEVTVKFINDARGGTAATEDRNLFLKGATYDGVAASNATANLWSNSSYSFTVGTAVAKAAPVPLNLIGTAAADVLAGAATNDTLRGGLGADTLTGGGGNDLFAHAKGDGADTITDFAAKGAGADKIELDRYAFSSFAQIQSHLAQHGADTVLTLNDTDSIVLKGVTASDLGADNFVFADVVSPSTHALSVGININGAEYIGPAGQKTGVDYFPTHEELQYFAAKGLDTIRLPIAWESLQHSLNGALDPTYLAKIQDMVAYAKTQGLNVIVDLHNYGAYNGQLIGSAAVPTSAFADVWSKLSAALKGSDNVSFDLMNEPQQETASIWLPMVNAAIAAIRATGATQQVLIPGVHWDGGVNWTTSDNATVLGKAGAIVDPLGNYAFEIHQYLDPATAGQSSEVVSSTIGSERLAAVTDWARTAGVKLFLGEIGVAADSASTTALDNTLAFLKSNEDIWQGVTYWAAGEVWQGKYIYSAEPTAGIKDAAQMDVLEKYVDAKVVQTLLADGSHRIDTFGFGDSHASMTDIVDASNHLVSRIEYDPSGQMLRQWAGNADGSGWLTSYDATSGKPLAAKLLSAAGTLISDKTFATDGGYTLQTYAAGTGTVVHSEQHGADGALLSSADDTASVHVRTSYENGVVKQIQTFSASWSFLDTLTYDDSGKLQQHSYVQSDGHYALDSYDATGRITSHGDFNADWSLASWVTYQADGGKNVKIVHTDGSIEYDYFHAGQLHAFQIDQFDALGHLAASALYPTM